MELMFIYLFSLIFFGLHYKIAEIKQHQENGILIFILFTSPNQNFNRVAKMIEFVSLSIFSLFFFFINVERKNLEKFQRLNFMSPDNVTTELVSNNTKIVKKIFKYQQLASEILIIVKIE